MSEREEKAPEQCAHMYVAFGTRALESRISGFNVKTMVIRPACGVVPTIIRHASKMQLLSTGG